MILTIKHSLKQHKSLLITAIVLYLLSVITVWYHTYSYTPSKVQNSLNSYLQKEESKIQQLITDTATVIKLLQEKGNEEIRENISQEQFGVFVYKKENALVPAYWSTNKFSPNVEDITKPNGRYFVTYQNGNFELVKQTFQHKGQQVNIIALIPIYWHFFIDNKYLNAGFNIDSKLSSLYEITSNVTPYSISNSEGKTLFYLQAKSGNNLVGYTWLTIALRTIAIICFLFFINAIANALAKKDGFARGFLFLVTSVGLLRLLSYTKRFPFNFSQLRLFDPSIYASNFIHPSLGDLFINSLLLLWLVLYVKFYTNATFIKSKINQHKSTPYLMLILLSVFTLVLSATIMGMVTDSKVSFDVNNFFSLNVYSVVSFIILCVLILVFFHASHILLRYVFAHKISLIVQALVVAIVGLLAISLNAIHAITIPLLGTIAWLIIYLVLLHFRQKDIHLSIVKSTFFIVWAMFFTASVATLLMYENAYTELEQRKKWADKLATQNDPNSENLLKIAITNFNDYFLTNNYHRFTQEFSNKYIKDSLVNENFSGYLNKYDTRIYTFDSLYKPLYNEDSATYASLKTIVSNHGVETSIPNLYNYNNNNQKQAFIYETAILKDSLTLGYLFVTVKPKKYKSEALYPELFRQVQDLSSDFNTNYAFAIYNNSFLVDHFNDYSFAANLKDQTIPKAKYETRKNSKYNELWYNAGNGKVIIIAKKKTALLELFTLFAYMFCIFLVLLACYHVTNFLRKSKLNKIDLQYAVQFNIRTQIHATIIFISIFSFFIIGIATISFFIFRFNQNNEERLSKSIQVMANEIEEKVKDTRNQLAFDDVLTINDIGFGTNMEKTVTEISEVHNIDVNFYNSSGTLVASTQPYIFNKHLLSDKMHPQAFYELHTKKNIRCIQTEQIASFDYLSIYVPVNDENGETYAYLNIPYFNSRSELNQEISGFLATLLNLNAFIFLLAGAIAYFATERITSSFSIISEKMKAINLGEHNEEIVWNRNDEIGVLIAEYNKMVQKLEDSAKALAKSEREGAWREMARQVAHEIKNPLTPMKLSIQYLQKSIDNNSDNVKDLTNRVANTLVEQIEQLSKIAGDFSQFANIGNVKPEEFDVSEIIQSLIQLNSTRENIHIEWNKAEGNYIIKADRVQISRLFANLFLNAIEASIQQNEIKIIIHQSHQNNMLSIAIQDFGVGINDDLKNKIFTPNFTTKSSGTGLGLAICKGIAEKANGTINFQTEKDKGTTFIVQLPLLH